MFSFSKRVFLPIFLILFVVGAGLPLSHAIQAAADPCSADPTNETKAQLQADLDACTADIQKWTDILNQTKKTSATYASEVATLTAKINVATSNIKAKTAIISGLSRDISAKQSKINDLSGQITTDMQTIALLLRKTNEIDSYSLADAILSKKDLSDFFADVDAYSATHRSLQQVTAQLQDNKSQTETEKANLDQQKEAETDARTAIEQAKAQVEAAQQEQKALLSDSQNKEKIYAQTVADKQAQAARIRSALFPLVGVDTQIQFSAALAYAQAAGRVTGVRPALILGILQQESNLGANVGTCVITNLSTGETKNVNTGRVYANGIHPTRDLPLLQNIVTGLGRDPLTTRVSCPIGSVGYGGAMGPTQFIPSTWQLIANRIAGALGKTLPDPWNPQDAIYATALKLADDGAALQTTTAERNAACRYYSGKSCASGPGASYGTQVMAKTAAIQANIDLLQES